MSALRKQNDIPVSKPRSDIIQMSLLVTVFLFFLLSVTFSTVGILVLQRIGAILTDVQRLANYAHIIVYVVSPFIGASGIYAISLRKTKATSYYLSFTFGHTLFGLVSGILCLYVFWHARSFAWNMDGCLGFAHDAFSKDLCRRGSMFKGIGTALFAVMWLIEFAIILLGHVFLIQLHEEEMRMDMFDSKHYDADARNC